jgi:hypothetical protein
MFFFVSFNLLMLALFFSFTLCCTSSPKYFVKHLLVQTLVLKKEEDGLPNYKYEYFLHHVAIGP